MAEDSCWVTHNLVAMVRTLQFILGAAGVRGKRPLCMLLKVMFAAVDTGVRRGQEGAEGPGRSHFRCPGESWWPGPGCEQGRWKEADERQTHCGDGINRTW